jgi:hypothetical protein
VAVAGIVLDPSAAAVVGVTVTPVAVPVTVTLLTTASLTGVTVVSRVARVFVIASGADATLGVAVTAIAVLGMVFGPTVAEVVTPESA